MNVFKVDDQMASKSLACYGPLIVDVKVCCSVGFFQLHYSHVKREDNKMAHSFARCARFVLDFIVWLEDIPPQFVSVYQVDLAKLP